MSHANESMSSQTRICVTRSQNKSSELCESYQV